MQSKILHACLKVTCLYELFHININVVKISDYFLYDLSLMYSVMIIYNIFCDFICILEELIHVYFDKKYVFPGHALCVKSIHTFLHVWVSSIQISWQAFIFIILLLLIIHLDIIRSSFFGFVTSPIVQALIVLVLSMTQYTRGEVRKSEIFGTRPIFPESTSKNSVRLFYPIIEVPPI